MPRSSLRVPRAVAPPVRLSGVSVTRAMRTGLPLAASVIVPRTVPDAGGAAGVAGT
jgi:hypothetical protein